SCRRDHRDPHSFPTRRSSDLEDAGRQVDVGDEARAAACADLLPVAEQGVLEDVAVPCARAEQRVLDGGDLPYPVRSEVLEEEVRSEEHTSELQSRENLVCRLL